LWFTTKGGRACEVEGGRQLSNARTGVTGAELIKLLMGWMMGVAAAQAWAAATDAGEGIEAEKGNAGAETEALFTADLDASPASAAAVTAATVVDTSPLLPP
jgi:hypothetical protein